MILKKSKDHDPSTKKIKNENFLNRSFFNRIFAQKNNNDKTTQTLPKEQDKIDNKINELKKLFKEKNVDRHYDCVSYGYADSSNFLFRSFDMNSNLTQNSKEDHSISIKTYLTIEYDKVSINNDLKLNKNMSSFHKYLKNKFIYYFQKTFEDIHSKTNGSNVEENEQVFSTSSNHMSTATSISPTTSKVKKGVVLLICNEVYEGLDFFKETYNYIVSLLIKKLFYFQFRLLIHSIR